MIQKKHQKIISILISIIIIGSLLTGCSSSQPVSKNVTVTTQQQNQQKIDAEKKANEEAIVKANQETAELKAQLVVAQEAKVQAEEKAKIESDARILAEEQTKKETEARIQAEAATVANNNIVEQEPVQNHTNSGVMVWLSATGSKYHAINNCGRMNPDNATQVTLEEAKNSYGPCSKCGPPQ